MRSRLESLDVVAAMGKSRKHRSTNKKVERDARADDVIALNKNESGKNGDPPQGKEAVTGSVDSVEKNMKIASYQDMEYETEINSQEREREMNRLTE